MYKPMLFINRGNYFKFSKVEEHYHFQVAVYKRIKIQLYDNSFPINVHDGPGPLSPPAPDHPTDNTLKLTTSFQGFVRYHFVTEQSVYNAYINADRNRSKILSWEPDPEIYRKTPICKNSVNGTLHHDAFGPCILYDTFEIIEIRKMIFTGYNRIQHNQFDTTCQYGGFYIISDDLIWPAQQYDYISMCANITETFRLPYVDFTVSVNAFSNKIAYVVFATFPGYSSGYIDLKLYDISRSPYCVYRPLVIASGPLCSNYYSDIEMPDAEGKTPCTDLWLVNELHFQQLAVYNNCTFSFDDRHALFPSGPFKMITASSFVLQRNVQLKTSLQIAIPNNVVTQNKTFSIPFQITESQINSSTHLKFKIFYSGYGHFPVFALNIQLIQIRTLLCLPIAGYAVHQQGDQE